MWDFQHSKAQTLVVLILHLLSSQPIKALQVQPSKSTFITLAAANLLRQNLSYFSGLKEMDGGELEIQVDGGKLEPQ